MSAPRRPPPGCRPQDPQPLDPLPTDPQPSGPQRTALLVLTGPVARTQVPALCDRLEVLLRRSGADRVVCDVGALGPPDAATLDALARLRLTAARQGRELLLRGAGGALRALLSLTGLDEVLPLCPESPVGRSQAVRQTEEREERLGVEE